MDKQVDLIGKRLKKSREGAGMTFDDVYAKTRIHPRILEALEEGRAAEFLSTVYIKSFLKNYAQCLGIADDDLIKGFLSLPTPRVIYKDEERDEGMAPRVALQPEAIEQKKQGVERDYKKILTPTVTVVTIALALWLVVFVGMKLVSGIRTAAGKVSTAIASREASKEVLATPEVTKDGFRIIPVNERLSLKLVTAQDLWLEVKSDNKIVFRRILPGGSSETWKADHVIELWLGKAEAASLSLNGRKLRSPGRGVVKGIQLTREGMSFSKR